MSKVEVFGRDLPDPLSRGHLRSLFIPVSSHRRLVTLHEAYKVCYAYVTY